MSNLNYYYTVVFASKDNQKIFLANNADITKICYTKSPKLPATLNLNEAKRYSTPDEAKADVYKLRYHHRSFINIPTAVIKIGAYDNLKPINNNIKLYTLTELKALVDKEK